MELPVNWELNYFNTGEWQVVQEKLDEAPYNPGESNLFEALKLVPPSAVRVAIIGQDPYPSEKYSTGVAFSIPEESSLFPPTLANIFAEYAGDLHYPVPRCGSLLPWVRQGVLLWNAIPSCKKGTPGSHRWDEWSFLTKEIVEKLSAKGVVFVFLGSIAQSFAEYVDAENNEIINLSHPSPLGVNKGRHPFNGSRLFSTVNDKLCSVLKHPPINWRLP